MRYSQVYDLQCYNITFSNLHWKCIASCGPSALIGMKAYVSVAMATPFRNVVARARPALCLKSYWASITVRQVSGRSDKRSGWGLAGALW